MLDVFLDKDENSPHSIRIRSIIFSDFHVKILYVEIKKYCFCIFLLTLVNKTLISQLFIEYKSKPHTHIYNMRVRLGDEYDISSNILRVVYLESQ